LVPLPPAPPTRSTRLRANAVCWEPLAASAQPATDPEAPTWRVGAPGNAKTQKRWEDSAADVVATMVSALSQLTCISRVDCRPDGANWVVTVHSSPGGHRPQQHWQHEQIQTVAKASLAQAAENSECMWVLGHKHMPFQQSPMGFFASLGSMRNTKKACYDVYDRGVCPRGCSCLWEHPAVVSVVNVMIDFSETTVF